MSWIYNSWRKKEKTSKAYREPMLGIWQIIDRSGDPFPPKHQTFAEVFEELDGWVRYRLLPTGGAFQDERKTIKEFLWCYERKK